MKRSERKRLRAVLNKQWHLQDTGRRRALWDIAFTPESKRSPEEQESLDAYKTLRTHFYEVGCWKWIALAGILPSILVILFKVVTSP